MWAWARRSLRVEILEHGRKRLADRLRILPVPDFLADLFGLEHAGIGQHPKVMRHRGTRKRGRRDDLSDVEPLARLEHQHDPLPVRIVLMFEPGERLNVGQIVAASTLSRSAVSHHLRVLPDAGVLQSEKIGKEVWYRQDPEAVRKALSAVLQYLDSQ